MTSETDAEFLDRLEATQRYNPSYRTLDSDRLFDLARRGAEAADRIEQLEAEVLTWQGHAKTAIWGDSEECKSLSAEVDRLVRSRNKWGQRYNKLLLKIRAGESGETDDPASWQLRMALDDANGKNDEAAARIAQLEAAMRELLEADDNLRELMPRWVSEALIEGALIRVRTAKDKARAALEERT